MLKKKAKINRYKDQTALTRSKQEIAWRKGRRWRSQHELAPERSTERESSDSLSGRMESGAMRIYRANYSANFLFLHSFLFGPTTNFINLNALNFPQLSKGPTTNYSTVSWYRYEFFYFYTSFVFGITFKLGKLPHIRVPRV